jgi:hypothetical protein
VGFNAVHSVDAFLGDIKSGKWDAVLSQVSDWLGIVMGSLLGRSPVRIATLGGTHEVPSGEND